MLVATRPATASLDKLAGRTFGKGEKHRQFSATSKKRKDPGRPQLLNAPSLAPGHGADLTIKTE